jgi:hypothetical protein
MKKKSEYTAAEWWDLYPEQRYAAEQAENDAKLGRNLMPVRAADGRGVIYVDPITKQPVAAKQPSRRMG